MSSPHPDRPRLAALPPVCHLCGHPADEGQPVVLHPAACPPRPVSLCEPCRSGRPARDSPDLGPADVAWCVLARDAGSLLRDYEGGQWLPYEEELRFAEDLAHLHWTEGTMRTAQRTAPAGRLALLLDSALFVLRYAGARDLLPLRALVDVLADEAEHQLPPAAGPMPFREIRAHSDDVHTGGGRHRAPDTTGDLDPWPSWHLPAPEPKPARHRRARQDDPAPDGVTSLWEWRYRSAPPHGGPGG